MSEHPEVNPTIVLVSYLRGYGTTASFQLRRSGMASHVARGADAVALPDAPGIPPRKAPS